jgi:hypothetical protein
MISFYEGDTINVPALTTMLRQIVANNRARRSQKQKGAAEHRTGRLVTAQAKPRRWRRPLSGRRRMRSVPAADFAAGERAESLPLGPDLRLMR